MTDARRSEAVQFLSYWARHPLKAGSIVPSGRRLAAAMAARVAGVAAGPIVELGAGTGPITEAVLAAGIPPARLVAVEADAVLCATLRRRFSDVDVLCGDAGELSALLQPVGITRAAAIVSSLPLLTMSEEARHRVVDAAFGVLGDEAPFVQFTFGLGQPIPGDLRGAFGLAARRTGWILSNLPPASIWIYRRVATPARQLAA